MTAQRESLLDWMKCLGICLIVYGHVAGATIDNAVPPIYPKQLGVAFFVFAMGFSLARETRPPWKAVFNRLFEMYLFGLALAVVMSAFRYFQDGRLSLSNYLPFLLGTNVVSTFPANPTTWFVGTYLHLLLLWVLVIRHVRFGWGAIVAVVVVEIVARSVLLRFAGPYVAYMLVTNWSTVFLLGIYCGRGALQRSSASLLWYAAGLIAVVSAWPLVGDRIPIDRGFPFRTFVLGAGPLDIVATSAIISLVYVAYTVAVFQVTRQLPEFWLVRAVARNTLIVFLGHMPLFYWLDHSVAQWDSYLARVVARLLICFVFLLIVSEVITRVVQPKQLRDQVWRRFEGRVPDLASTPM
jgi:fucose 4-O-acetylase-like acetyltransferase